MDVKIKDIPVVNINQEEESIELVVDRTLSALRGTSPMPTNADLENTIIRLWNGFQYLRGKAWLTEQVGEKK